MPTPTGNENLAAALAMAQSICWDERVGYIMGADMNPNTDCSGLIGYVLSQNGFNVNRRWDTTNMIRDLQQYPGFTEYIYDPTQGFTFRHGDIVVYDEGGGDFGHTFFIGENVYGYTGTDWRTATSSKSTLSICKIEAAGKHLHPETGDQDNGHGAHTEVWIHAYSGSPVYQVDNNQGLHWPVWHIFRWQQGPTPGPSMLDILLTRWLRKRRNQLP